jgi:hypothetical protein
MEATKTENITDVNAVGGTKFCLDRLLENLNDSRCSPSFCGDKLIYVHVKSQVYNKCLTGTRTTKREDYYNRMSEVASVTEMAIGEGRSRIHAG